MFLFLISDYFSALLQEVFTEKKDMISIAFFFFFLRLKCPYETAVELAALCLQGMQSFESGLS